MASLFEVAGDGAPRPGRYWMAGARKPYMAAETGTPEIAAKSSNCTHSS